MLHLTFVLCGLGEDCSDLRKNWEWKDNRRYQSVHYLIFEKKIRVIVNFDYFRNLFYEITQVNGYRQQI